MAEYGNGERRVTDERVKRLTRQTDYILDEWRPQVDRDRVLFAEQIRNLIRELDDLTKAVNGLRRTILTFALSIAASAVVFALTTLAATGRI